MFRDGQVAYESYKLLGRGKNLGRVGKPKTCIYFVLALHRNSPGETKSNMAFSHVAQLISAEGPLQG